MSRAETIRKLLPVVIQSLRESIQRPLNSHSRSNRAYFFKIVAGAVEGIVNVFVQDESAKETEEDPVGQFVRTLDLVLDFCVSDGQESLDEVCDKVEWMVKFSLAVAKVSEDRSGAEIVANCQSVMREAQRLRNEVDKAACSSGNSLKRSNSNNKSGSLLAFHHREITVAKDILKDAVEDLEQSLNNSLLRLIIELFCRAHSPLDELIHRVLNSPVSPPERRPEDVDDGVAAFDEWADLLFHVSHFATFCTNDRRRSRAIHSSLGLMQQLETELVPACLKLYFNPDDQGAKAHLRLACSSEVK